MTDRSPEENPSVFRRPGWIASAALLVAILVVGAVVIFWPRGSDNPDPPPTTGTGTEATTETAEPADPDASICGLEPGDQTVPTAPPADATWTLHGTFAAPSIDGIGPGLTDEDGLAHCFAQSPTGALLAAINYWAMGAVDPYFGLSDRLVADTPEAQQAREQQDEEASESGTQTEVPVYQLVGFDVVSYRDDVVQVNVVLRLSESAQLVLAPTPLRWESGDWRYVYPANGDPGFEAIDPNSAYIEWAGV